MDIWDCVQFVAFTLNAYVFRAAGKYVRSLGQTKYQINSYENMYWLSGAFFVLRYLEFV